jgi:hypothetical protein
MAKIEDGTGLGFDARVDENNRFHVHAVGVTEVVHAAEQGLAFNINTGQISVTADATLVYLKNNETNDFVVEAIAIGNDGGATYSTRPLITVVRNPTGGDLITDQTDVDMNQNRDFGSSRVFNSNAYKGKTGGTLTGGNDIAILQSTTGGRDFFTLGFVLTEGSSIGLSYTANISAGTSLIYVALVGYLRDPAGQDN